MNDETHAEGQSREFSTWQHIRSWALVSIISVGIVVGLWWLLLSPRDSEIFVIQGVNDECFRKLEMSTYEGPDEWSMKVCISANNGYVDENGKVIHP